MGARTHFAIAIPGGGATYTRRMWRFFKEKEENEKMELSAAFLSFQRYTRQVPQFGKGEGRTLSISGSLNFRLAWHTKGGKRRRKFSPRLKKSRCRGCLLRGVFMGVPLLLARALPFRNGDGGREMALSSMMMIMNYDS